MSVIASESDIDCTQFHEWFPLLQQHSIKSIILDVQQNFIDYLGQDGLRLPGQDQNSSLLPLRDSIAKAIRDLGGEVFVKTNWSAPIDAIWVNTNTAKCVSADEVLCLLKSSDRTTFDMEKMYDLCPIKTKTSPASKYIVARKWANLTPSMEFRMFVKNGQLKGICQRECSTFFPFLREQVDSLEDQLVNFFEDNLMGKLAINSYVVDVYIDRKGRVWVIDVNPFGSPTSALMFEWEDFDGYEDIEFRVVMNEDEKYARTTGSARGPIDVHMSEDFSKFMEICQAQQLEDDSDDDGDD